MVSKYDNLLEKLSSPSSPWTEANERSLLEPFTYITSQPGKEIRGRLIEAFNQWLNVPAEQLKTIAKLVSMFHSASLLIDDIEDDSQLRRGGPVAHKIFGVPQTINSANYIYFLAYHELFSLRPSTNGASDSNSTKGAHEIEHMVTDELMDLHRGQGLELLWRDTLQCPTEEEYISMVNNKTGGLLRIAVKLMMACATTNTQVDYVPLVNLLGIYYQIRDDYMNLQSAQYEKNKGFAEDLTEGKFSFPVVHGIRADTSNRQILNILQKRPATPTLKTYTISYLKNHTKSFEYTLEVLRSLERQILDEISKLGGNPMLLVIVKALEITGDKPPATA